jgi:hypothetical protein
MKNIKKSILAILSCLLLTGLSSCLFEEKNVFSESAAKRINDALANNFELLTSSPSGWVLDYFPTDEQEGYTLLVRFDKNGLARIATKNRWSSNQYVDTVSLFRMIGDNGPVLTFDSYNEILHFFSNPEDLVETKDDPETVSVENDEQGRGLEGDYEFIVMEASENEFLLKGKKRGVFMRLRRLAENQDWKAYFDQLEEINTRLFSDNIPNIWMYVGDSIFTLSNGLSHIFDAIPLGGDPITDREKVPFIVTNYGIHFAKPFEVGDQSVQTFKLNEDNSALICTGENVNAKIKGTPPVNFFFDMLNLNKNLVLIENTSFEMSPKLKTVYDEIVRSTAERNRKLTQVSISNSKTWNTSLVLTLNASGRNTDFFFSYSFLGDSESEISFTFNGFNSQTDPNAKIIYDLFEGIDDFLSLMNGKFTMSVIGNLFIPNKMKLTSVSDSDIWVILNVK